MSDENREPPRRVLIASANPLFARGLEKLMVQRWENRNAEIRFAGSMQEISAVLESWQPDLVILDYDDAGDPGGALGGEPGSIQREAFLSQFIAGNRPMQVMLVSLRASGEVIVYDRRTLTPAQAEDWLDLPWVSPSSAEKPPVPPAAAQGSKTVPARLASGNHVNSRSGGMKHYVFAGILTLIMTLIMGALLSAIGLMPLEASTQAAPVDAMISLQVWMIAFLFSLITVFIVYSIFVFRHRRRSKTVEMGISTAPGAKMSGSNTLEVTWTIVPLVTVIFLAFLGARDLGQIRQPDSSALEVRVTAFQWGWSFQYPNGNFISSTLVLPVNRQVRLVMSSRDVIHSFWVPEFRLKQDVLPGENLVKELRITPNRVGFYKVRCAEMCGLDHAYMESQVIVVSQAGFEDWVVEKTKTAQSAASGSPAERGAGLAQSTGCIGCHSVDGSAKIGPTWKGLAGSQVKLSDGSTATADDAYLHDSVVNPNKHIREGFPPGVMPQNYGQQLTDDQIKDIIEYIKSLK